VLGRLTGDGLSGDDAARGLGRAEHDDAERPIVGDGGHGVIALSEGSHGAHR